MNEGESGFTVVDRRSQSDSTPEVAVPTEEEAMADVEADGAADEAIESERDEDASSWLPPPGAMLSMIAPQVPTVELIKLMVHVFGDRAWSDMGLVADRATNQVQIDMPSAQLAIDCVSFLLGRVEKQMEDGERRDAARRLTDLRINYVSKSKDLA